MMKQKALMTALAVASLTLLGSAYAQKNPDNDAISVLDAKVSLTQAITAAEQHLGGRAARAEFELAGGRQVFDVEVVKGKQVFDVKVDPQSGHVLSTRSDAAEHDDGNDRAD